MNQAPETPFVPSPTSPVRRWDYRLRQTTVFQWRLWTSRRRVLPAFVIGGVQKGGTTPFFHNLVRHPQIVAPYKKEVHFFNRHYHEGIGWYRAHFPTARALAQRAQQTGRPAYAFEATPDYLFDPRAPQRIGDTLLDARFLLFLRNPVDRAYSHYHMMVARGYEPLPFAEAVRAEEERLQHEWLKIETDEHFLSHPLRLHSYLARGRYAEQLERWFAAIPREHTLIVSSEEARRDPGAVFRLVTDHLGIDPIALPEVPAKRQNARAYDPMEPAVRAELEAYFRPHNQALYKLLGRDLGWG